MQVTSSGYGIGHRATVNKQHFKCLLAQITIRIIEWELLVSVFNICDLLLWPVTSVLYRPPKKIACGFKNNFSNECY